MEAVTAPPTSTNLVQKLHEHQMALPGMDGYTAEKLSVSLSGSLDKTSSSDVDVLSKLKMFQTVELTVTALVTRKGFAGTQSDDKGDQLGYAVGLKVLEFELA